MPRTTTHTTGCALGDGHRGECAVPCARCAGTGRCMNCHGFDSFDCPMCEGFGRCEACDDGTVPL